MRSRKEIEKQSAFMSEYQKLTLEILLDIRENKKGE